MTAAQKFLDGAVELRPGDCREVIKAIPDNSIDSIVTDPPYALVSIVKRFGKPGSAPPKDYGPGNGLAAYARSAAGFMGKQWDTGEAAFAVEFWAECFRVLKPGGHVAAFAGTRTYHRLACAIEDAGFEIRDQIAWVYGSGFAKSHAVDLGLWKGVLSCQSKDNAPLVVQLSAFTHLMSDAAKEPIAAAPALILPEGAPALIMETGKAGASPEATVILLSVSDAENISLSTGWSWKMNLVGNSDPRSMYTTKTKSNPITIPGICKLLTLPITQKFTRVDVTLKNGWKWPAVAVETNSNADAMSKSAIPILTALEGATWNPVAQAKGIGTGIKPSHEPICLARKPLIGTVAQNVLAHGTGAINIDGCRVPTDEITGWSGAPAGGNTWNDDNSGLTKPGEARPVQGRFPANLVHDGSDEVIAAFPDTGASKASAGRNGKDGAESTWALNRVVDVVRGHDDAGGSAARFFYSAKADANDRIGSKHPTVKPVDLMQWLCRLITPPGGTILDPFAGTGTTGEAAWREKFRAILIEREAEYQADIENRMRLAMAGPDERKHAIVKSRERVAGSAGPLFDGDFQ